MTEYNFFTVKGGQGCSVIAAAFAVHLSQTGTVALIDMAPNTDLYDLYAVLGCYCPDGEPVIVAPNLSLYNADTPYAWQPDHVVYDWGTNPVTNPDGVHLLVTRPDYLALMRYMRRGQPRCDGVVLITEEGRALRAVDVEAVIEARVLTEIAVDPAVARSVDAGLLASRIRSLAAPMARLKAHPQETL